MLVRAVPVGFFEGVRVGAAVGAVGIIVGLLVGVVGAVDGGPVGIVGKTLGDTKDI